MAMKEVLKERLSSSVGGEELTEALVLIRTRAPDLDSVRKLNCWACNIGDVNVVRRMPNLEVCSLTINKLTSLRDFAHCHNLQELYVRTNNIQHLSDIHYLRNLKTLRSLWLSENPCASRNNYRLTVLKVLPKLHKLDNVVVTGEEVARAQTEGDDLPVPGDFSFSGVLRESTVSSDDITGNKKGENVSSSSEKWAQPRQKRQQKKREEYWKEKRRAGDDSGSTKSGDDGSGGTRSGEDGGDRSMRSSSDSADGEDWYRSKVDEPVSSSRSRNDSAGQEHDEEEGDRHENIFDVKVDDEVQIDDHSTRAKWALNIEIPDSNTSGIQDNLELQVENLDNVMNSDQNDIDYAGSIIKETNAAEEKPYSNSKDENICQKDDDEDQDASAANSSVETEASKASKLFNPIVAHDGSSDVSKFIDSSSSSLLVTDTAPALKLVTSVYSIDVTNMTSVDSNTNANTDYEARVDSAKGDQLICEGHLSDAVTSSIQVIEQTDTPLLDNIKLEDTVEFQESTEGQTLKSNHMGGLAQELKNELPENLSAQAARTESIDSHSVVNSLSDTRELVDWEEYNRMRVQLGVGPANRIPITARSFNSEVTRARNSNILQAVLCLIKELDKDSLDIVATVVKARLDGI